MPLAVLRAFHGSRWLCALGLGVLVLVVALVRPAEARAGRGELLPSPTRRFERVDTTHGFPQSSVYDLVERGDGYLWLTTLDGLVRFDGVRHRVFATTSAGLATSRLTALAVSPRSGDPWIGTEDGRIVRMRDERFITLPLPHADLGGVTGLQFSGDGQRLFVFQQAGGQALEVHEGAEPSIEPLGPPVAGICHYGHCSTLFDDRVLWRAGASGFRAIPLPPELHDEREREIRSDGRGTVWLHARGRVWRVHDQQVVVDERSASLPHDAIPLGEDARGDLWLRLRSQPYLGRLDRDGHVFRYDPRTGIDPFAEPVMVHVDREDGLWIGTTVGLYRHLGEAISGLVWRSDGVETPVAAYLEASDGDTWIEGRDKSLAVLEPDGTSVPLTELGPDGNMVMRREHFVGHRGEDGSGEPVVLDVRVFREDAAGQVWVGANAGLFVHRGDHTLTTITDLLGVNDVLLEEGGLWVVTRNLVARVEDDRLVAAYGPGQGIDGEGLAILRDREGTLLLGTSTGVVGLVGERFEPVEGLGPPLGAARALHQDAEGRLWVGTYDHGLFRRRLDGVVEHLGPANGLPSGGVFTLHFDTRGSLWITSNRGLVRARVDDVERVLARGEGTIHAVLYGTNEGLPAAECNGGFGNDGYLCEGGDAWCMHTLAGVAVARVDDIRRVASPPVPVIEDVEVDGVPRAPDGGRLTVLPGDHDLVVRYTGAAFEGAADVTFRYRLRGRDDRWVPAETRREAIFSDLPPGEYELEIHAESREGVGSPEPARLVVTVVPAWWERAAVRWGAVLVALGLVASTQRWRMRIIERRHHREEATLRAAAEELERRVRERTAVLDEEVIERRRAEEAARQASAVKSAFLAQMSHELRTPMNAILGLSELLSKTSLSPEQRTWVKTVRSSGDALLSLIDDVLDFSRIEAGRIELEHRDFDPAAIVEEALEIVTQSARAKGLALAKRVAPGLPTRVVGDPSRIRQILLNLLGNAIKFTTAGTVEVWASTTADPETGGWRLELVVRDTGIGIGPVERERIFEPFTQAEASTSRRFGGTGLGLAIVRGLVERLGGTIALESTVDVGSMFTVVLPVARPTTTAATSEPVPAPVDLQGLRVLLTEDDPINQLVAKALLRACGCECSVASSGAEALAMATAQRFDVVLMDLHMPGMGGLETTRRLRAELPPSQQPWVIAATAAVTVEDRDECLAAGMDDFIGKPIGEEALRRALARARGPARAD